jgi:threonine aldolase
MELAAHDLNHPPPSPQLPSLPQIIKSIREDDPHYPRTDVVAIENTHNVLGGVPIPKSYVDALGTKLASEHALPLHIDGARIFNACVALNTSPKDLCENASSVSICLSKGLGSPVGSVLVGSEELIYRARRQRKACGGGMRQAGVIAAAGIYAIENNVERLAEDHQKAMYLSKVLSKAGYVVNREPETNLFFFGLPDDSKTSLDEIVGEAEKHGILFGGGYSGGTQCRLAAHKDVSMEDIEEAARVISELIK